MITELTLATPRGCSRCGRAVESLGDSHLFHTSLLQPGSARHAGWGP